MFSMGVLRHHAGCMAAAVAAWLASPAALAQSAGNACDQLKATLAARIEATGVRGYSLEALPADAPMPKDGRVIGNCEGGAFKMVYRRFGGSSPAAADAAPVGKVEAAKPEAPKPEVPRAEAPKVEAPKVESPKPVPPKPVIEKAAPSPSPSPLPSPSPSPRPVATAPAETPVAVVPPPPAPPVSPAPEASPRGTATAEAPPASEAEGSLLGAWWPWLGLGLGLPLLWWGWSRVSYRLHYDEAGLPSGARLS